MMKAINFQQQGCQHKSFFFIVASIEEDMESLRARLRSPIGTEPVNQYLSDDFLGSMETLPDLGLQEPGRCSAGKLLDTQQTSSTASWQDETDRPRLPSPLNLDFPDFSDILGLESAGDSAATRYNARDHSPQGTRYYESREAAHYSPLLAHPVTPVVAARSPEMTHSPMVAERPAYDARHSQTDFATIYAFLGSLFDPVCAQINHWDVLAQMAPVDRETACLLMHNLAANLGDSAAVAAHPHSAGEVNPPAPPLRGADHPVYGFPPATHVPPGSRHVCTIVALDLENV
ncbi:hypothetical protein COCSUDRAFT_42447 [Coccomyxa subellipsoidea C-169]|uniref:Uncharacterized protein n=1 Tax=Coccomyxa subellipsoidea (strain C-169) TaxID=574566 RepID=I0YWU0_COCSC|nr:hypothetical protein COCSUDRAFT_42447 [Coccomyxa subellipsoidea C-169]EIE22859.1 hypothetical protein COCSUDRAFT_42447 [Coccomyxa subellipsoidea C-169]|eukprot:XP_005647403.1 hypothetical protein COCSUDRAFT_42447 [Coccomyxa subellipsoidea C-169]